MIWGILALVACLTYCVQTEINKHFKICGFRLNTYRSLIATLIMIPAIPFMEWPTIPIYYGVILLEAVISLVCMNMQYNLAAKNNGRVALLHQHIALPLTFIAWLVIDESQRQFLIDNPQKTFGIILSFLIFMFSLQSIKKNDIGWQALLGVMPIAVMYSFLSVVSKLVLEMGVTLFEISLNFVFLSNVLMALIAIPTYIHRKKISLKPQENDIKASLWIAVFHTTSWIFVSAAVILTPNPAYVSVVTGLAPLFFVVYYKVRGYQDKASPIAGIFMMLAAFIILFCSQ